MAQIWKKKYLRSLNNLKLLLFNTFPPSYTSSGIIHEGKKEISLFPGKRKPMHNDHKKSVRTELIHFIMDQPKEKKKYKRIFYFFFYFVCTIFCCVEWRTLRLADFEYCGEVRKDFMENLKTKSQISLSVCHFVMIEGRWKRFQSSMRKDFIIIWS